MALAAYGISSIQQDYDGALANYLLGMTGFSFLAIAPAILLAEPASQRMGREITGQRDGL